jgi:5-hydroxyisourate hydrolase-like protein (transthyretin family)
MVHENRRRMGLRIISTVEAGRIAFSDVLYLLVQGYYRQVNEVSYSYFTKSLSCSQVSFFGVVRMLFHLNQVQSP